MNNAVKYRVCVDNFHAQFQKGDSVTVHITRDEAVEEIVTRNYESIDEDIMTSADGIADFDDEHDKWEREYSRLWAEKTNEISERGYEDGNGHKFYVREED